MKPVAGRIVLAGVLVAAVLVIYWPAVHGGFLFDDDALVSQSQLAQAPDGLRRIWFSTEPIDYWPVTNSSFWLEWRLWGARPFGYHMTNLVLHAASALLVWGVLRRLAVPGAFWGALLFAVHPVNVQSVAWIAQRKNTLSLAFFLLSVLWYLTGEMRRDLSTTPAPKKARSNREKKSRPRESVGPWDRWTMLSLLVFVLSMLSKGSAAVLPAVLLVVVWWRRRSIARAELLRLTPFFVVSIVFTLVNIWFQARAGAPIRDVTLLERVAGAGAVIWFYLSKALAPVGLMFMYPQWHVSAAEAGWWLPLAAAAAVTVLLWRLRRRPAGRALFAGWLFFCVALVPVLGLTDVYFMKYSLVADHYEYIALLAVTTLVGAAIVAARRPALQVVAGTAISVILGVATWGQARLYADPETLYRATIERNPSAWALRNNLGALLIDRGRDEEAVVQLREGLRLNPDLIAAHNNLCLALVRLARFDQAVGDCAAAAQQDPRLAMAHANLGMALMALGRARDAEPQLRTAIDLAPDYAEAHYNLAHLLLITGRAEEAVPHFQEVLRLRPDSAAARNELGLALEATGDAAGAERAFREALRLRPDFAEAQQHLAALLQHLHAEPEKAHGNDK